MCTLFAQCLYDIYMYDRYINVLAKTVTETTSRMVISYTDNDGYLIVSSKIKHYSSHYVQERIVPLNNKNY